MKSCHEPNSQKETISANASCKNGWNTQIFEKKKKHRCLRPVLRLAPKRVYYSRVGFCSGSCNDPVRPLSQSRSAALRRPLTPRS